MANNKTFATLTLEMHSPYTTRLIQTLYALAMVGTPQDREDVSWSEELSGQDIALVIHAVTNGAMHVWESFDRTERVSVLTAIDRLATELPDERR